MLEYWTVENTGWSGGISWFQTGGTDANPLRFESKYEAMEYLLAEKEELNLDTTQWRIVHTTFERKENREVTNRVWTII